MLAGQIDGRTLVVAPPAPPQMKKRTPDHGATLFPISSSMPISFPVGKLDDMLEKGTEKYRNIIIDEAHHYEPRRPRPMKNSPKSPGEKSHSRHRDALQQFAERHPEPDKTIQNGQKSTVPNLPDLESFFSETGEKLKRPRPAKRQGRVHARR